MLDQLVESKSNQKENRYGFLLTTFVLVVGLFFSAVLWSLFAKDLGMGTNSLELSALVAPIQVVENKPPESAQKQEKPAQSNKTNSAMIVRQANILRIDESPAVPKEVSVKPNTQKSRPNGYFLISDKLEGEGVQGSPSANVGRNGENGKGIGMQDSKPEPVEETRKVEPPPPPIIKKASVETRQKSIVVSDGVVNGKAKYLPKPIYSAAAKAVKASGDVNVQVTIDETGNVISAKAVGGHPLLKIEAEKAARDAKFNPTLLSNQPVKVSGVIVYKFSMQ